MLLELLLGKKIQRGRLTICLIILLCITLLTRALAIGISLYGFIMIVSDNTVSSVESALVNEIKIFGTIPLGRLLKGVVYSSVFVLMPLQMASGLLGFLGSACKHKVAIISHMIMLCISMSMLLVYFVLVGRVLSEFYPNVKTKFAEEILHGSERQELQSKLQCCGLVGSSNKDSVGCVKELYNEGCWDKWSSTMHTFCSTLMSLFVLSFCLETCLILPGRKLLFSFRTYRARWKPSCLFTFVMMINFAITDYKYRNIRIKEECSTSGKTEKMDSQPHDIIGDIFCGIKLYIQRSGILEFICRIFPILTAVLGIVMIAYGAACSGEYPDISDPSNDFTHFLIVDDSGLDLSELVTLISHLLIAAGCFTLIVAIFIIVFSYFPSLTVLFAHAIGLCACIVLKTVFIFLWVALYVRARASIVHSLRDLFSGHKFNYAWYSIVTTYDCCGIMENSDTIDKYEYWRGYNLRLCDEENDYRDKQTCTSAFEKSLDTFAKTTLCLLCISLVIDVLLLVYTHFKIRKLSSEEGVNTAGPKGIPTHFKVFLCKFIKRSRLNWIPISSFFLTAITSVAYISLGLVLNYDTIFTHVDVFHLFSNISIGGVFFSEILDELSETYISLAIFEVVLYIILVVTYIYKSKFLAVCGIVLQGIAAVATLAIMSRWIYVARDVSASIEDELLNNLEQQYTMGEDIDKNVAYFAKRDPLTYSWNSLMFKMECCGANKNHNFSNTGWFTNTRLSSTYRDVQVPSNCCKSKPSNRFKFGFDQNCQESIESDLIYEEGCDTKIFERFMRYCGPIFALGTINLLIHVVLIVGLVVRYRRLESKGQIDKNMNELWNSVKRNKLKFPFLLTSLIYAVLGLAIIIYGAINITNYPTFVISQVMSQINIIDMRFDILIVALCAGLIIAGIVSVCSASASIIASIKSNKKGFFIYVSFVVTSVFLKLILVISWIVVATDVNSNLSSALLHFYNGRKYLFYWNKIVTELNCCYDETDTCNNSRCTTLLETHFNTFTAIALTIICLMMLAEVVSLVLANVQVRRLSVATSDKSLGMSNMKGIPTYIIDSLKKMKAESGLNIVSLLLHGILFVFGLTFILFGLDAMHDEYFTEKDVEKLFDRLTFVGRSFSTTMTYYGVGFICVGLIEISLSVSGIISQCFTSKVLISSITTMRICFVLSLFIMVAVWINIHVEVAWNMYNELIADFRVHYATFGQNVYNREVNYWYLQSVDGATWSWNALFTKFSCCGVDGYRDFTLTAWYNKRPDSDIKIPVYCCETPERHSAGFDRDCQENFDSYNSTGCSNAVRSRFDMYSIVLYVTIGVFILIQMFQLILSVIRLVRLARRQISSFGDDRCLQCCMVFAKGLVIDEIKKTNILVSDGTVEPGMKYNKQNLIPEDSNPMKDANVENKEEQKKSIQLKRKQSTSKVTPVNQKTGTDVQENNTEGFEDISKNENFQNEKVQKKSVQLKKKQSACKITPDISNTETSVQENNAVGFDSSTNENTQNEEGQEKSVKRKSKPSKKRVSPSDNKGGYGDVYNSKIM